MCEISFLNFEWSEPVTMRKVFYFSLHKFILLKLRILEIIFKLVWQSNTMKISNACQGDNLLQLYQDRVGVHMI